MIARKVGSLGWIDVWGVGEKRWNGEYKSEYRAGERFDRMY